MEFFDVSKSCFTGEVITHRGSYFRVIIPVRYYDVHGLYPDRYAVFAVRVD